MSEGSRATRRTTRKERREALEKMNLAGEMFKCIKHFFPNLIPLLKETITDPRNKSYIKYELYIILFVRIISAAFNLSSMRNITSELNTSNALSNIAKMLGYEELPEIPHWSTINDTLERIDPDELETMKCKIVNRLIRSKAFNNSRIRNKYWQIVVDGSGLYSFSERHCEYCLTKEYKEDGVVVRTEYYHYVLEAKLVLLENVVISIATEFVENDPKAPAPKDGEKAKQDCELKAFYRLAKNLKSAFPRLPICLGLDSLYAKAPVFKICQEYGWHYIIRFKDGSIRTLAAEFHALKNMEPEQIFSVVIDDLSMDYKYVLGIPYDNYMINVAECIETNKKNDKVKTFVFITDMMISKKNCAGFIADGRRRWRAENEGFDIQKNHGFYLEHIFSKNYTAMKNHYLLIQIGHAISQLFTKYVRTKNINLTLQKLHKDLVEAFRTIVFSIADLVYINERCQIRLC